MLSELLPRALLNVTVLALTIPAQAKEGTVSIGQSNPGTLDINGTIDPQTLVTQVGAVAVPAMAAVLSSLQPNAGAGGVVPHRDKLRGPRSPERDGDLRRHWA